MNIKKILSYCQSVSLIILGVLLATLPIFFWDFLITYQFKPTVRPLYPIFYGTIFLAGVAAIVLGILPLIKKYDRTQVAKSNVIAYILPAISIVMGVALFAGLANVYVTTEYLAADKLYYILLVGLILGCTALVSLGLAGVWSIICIIKRRTSPASVKFALRFPLVFIIAGAILGAVITLPPDAAAKPFPDGLYNTTLYKKGDAGYHTFKIPTMIVAENGTILAFAEARTDSQEDWSKTDIVVRRSTDNGTTWSDLEVLFAEGELTLGNACPVVDKSTGFIWLVFCKQNYTVFKTHSEDNGQTWAEPEEITSDVKLPNWTWYATGPSHGIQLSDGTLVIPADHIVGRKMQAHVIFSKDNGATWQLGGTVPGCEEATVVELDNGDLYINVRRVKPGYRVTAISRDKGLTWTNVGLDKTLPDPACQGNMVKMQNPESPEQGIYLFTNAADKYHREKMTVRVSFDQCKTWQYSKVLYEGMASYSAIAVIDAEASLIGCIFEKGANFYAEEIVFTRFTLDYIINKE